MESLILKYKCLGITDVLHYEKFNLISISHHSTKIEGSTLTELETQILLDNGLTPKGKPINDTLMVTDHFKALHFIIDKAKNQVSITTDLVKEINSYVMKSTGGIYNTILREVDASKGMFRKGNVTAGVSYFPNYDKVERLTNELTKFINAKMSDNLTIDEKLYLSFDAHFNLVSIHPFYDGNGRTSRLLMNYIQAFYDLPLAIVNSEDKQEYIQALIDTRKEDNIQIFRDFMRNQYERYLLNEIKKFEDGFSSNSNKGFSFLF
ncbi:Fic family protein [Flavobacterium endoglycinae]|uniref:Fic family protein n=1 Tax=Flavobacterium endoglycinae TaxID=2816357 RepID=A0ABX7QB78_9FLAO|nr:Fic family protein [Flavobacterium endoglycinae]QSW88207.1 Fic family protein [Flavobacterium endoglycinae]